MEDKQIIALFWARDERALEEASVKYGAYCKSISYSILQNHLDAEECFNDVLLIAWTAMPPLKPNSLKLYLGTLTKNLSISRYRSDHALKRGGGQAIVNLEDLEHCVPSSWNIEDALFANDLKSILDEFLASLSSLDQAIFTRRYWYLDSYQDIAQMFSIPQGTIKSKIHRIRQKIHMVLPSF